MTSFQKLIGVSALIIALTLAYYLLVYIPKTKEQNLLLKQEQEKQSLYLQFRKECEQISNQNLKLCDSQHTEETFNKCVASLQKVNAIMNLDDCARKRLENFNP